MERDTFVSAVSRGLKMAEILVTLKVMPEDADTDMQELVERIKGLKIGRVDKVEEEPIAFGLVALKPSFIVEEEEGATDKLEEALRGVEGVGDVTVVGATRLL